MGLDEVVVCGAGADWLGGVGCVAEEAAVLVEVDVGPLGFLGDIPGAHGRGYNVALVGFVFAV